ncbi:TonB-dependent receptor [Acanthopleuribacter pedis]|uniref:TonB-dependent receptor n=1 Tax=Acanthopleuribacter pedis TaxID=442870 RepID=A0A8J7QIP2_9BACT|nr:TonB-dependent receptor [Acanthopleuribacter pedis]MBO1321035.1 TonB-dependent receptor [Acanthopleuribacter pedis]
MSLILILPNTLPALAAKDRVKVKKWKGTKLGKVLKQLREYDLNIVYSSALVKRRMKVRAQPQSAVGPLESMTDQQRRAFLDEVLAQHGLAVRDGPSKTLIVIKKNDRAALDFTPQSNGTVLHRDTGRPVAGVRIIADQDQRRAVTSNKRGGFVLPWRAEPPKTLTLEKEGFLPLQYRLTVQDRFKHFNIELAPIPVMLEQLVVTPSTYTLLSEGPESQVVFTKAEIDLLPRLSDDLYRAIGRLPGIAGGDFSSKFSIRGGEENEVMVLLDGIEIYDPFHLKDLQNIFSVFDSEAIDEVTFLAGGYPADYGNALSGVIDLKTKQPQDPWQTEIGLSFLNSHVRSSDRFAEGRGRWLVSFRNGYLDLARALDKIADFNFSLTDEGPNQELETGERFKFRDILAKVAFAPNAKWDFSLNVLSIDDLVRYDEENGLFGTNLLGNITDANFQSNDHYVWFRAEHQLNEKVELSSLAAYSEANRERAGFQERTNRMGRLESQFRLDDARETKFFEVQQRLAWQQSDRRHWRFGLVFRTQSTEYFYVSEGFNNESLVAHQNEPIDLNRALFLKPSGEQAYAFAAMRTELSEKWQADVGLRYDWQSYIEDDAHQISPRLNLSYRPNDHTSFRFAWGLFQQAPRTPELAIGDGQTEFGPVQKAQHWVAAVEQKWRYGWLMRGEVYYKLVDDPRWRYENRYTPVALFPESEDDRLLVDPESAKAYGAELFIKSNPAYPVSTWFSYSYGSSREKIDDVWYARNRDQRHAAQLGLNFAFSPRWHLNLAGSYHTGWPITPLYVLPRTNDDGSLDLVPFFGERNSERMRDFSRVDLRLSHTIPRRRGSWNFFIEVNNILGADNLCCIDHEFFYSEETGFNLYITEDYWLPLIPSFGVTRRF